MGGEQALELEPEDSLAWLRWVVVWARQVLRELGAGQEPEQPVVEHWVWGVSLLLVFAESWYQRRFLGFLLEVEVLER